MLIRDAELHFGPRVDVRIDGARIVELGERLSTADDEAVIDAQGGALLPGLRDHHLHLQALAAARTSIACGPPQVQDETALEAALRAAATAGDGWLRGVGFHESVCASLDRARLDRWIGERPLRIQHRSGRLWIFNSAALDALGVREAGDDPFERRGGRLTGRLYDGDAWLRRALPRQRPSLAALSRELASRGVIGVTDTTHTNGPDDLAHFDALHARGALLQEICVMGDARLDTLGDRPHARRGAHKFHLHEHELPDFEALCAAIRRSHDCGRGTAFHCVTRTELTFALAALAECGARQGDRIEHASIAPPELAAQIAALGLVVVTQPNFVGERGDHYLADVDADDQPWLYRLRGLAEAGVALAGSTNAPFGDADPWRAMQAACSRRTPDGAVLGVAEALTPEAALALFSGPLDAPARAVTSLAPGARADLCLLSQPWRMARRDLAAVTLQACWRGGALLWRGATSYT